MEKCHRQTILRVNTNNHRFAIETVPFPFNFTDMFPQALDFFGVWLRWKGRTDVCGDKNDNPKLGILTMPFLSPFYNRVVRVLEVVPLALTYSSRVASSASSAKWSSN